VISFIIPAHNEEALIGGTLSALHDSARALGEPYEIIVANDASTDRTEAVALEHGAGVVAVNRRHIAATRNAERERQRASFSSLASRVA
jgi:glycosyltransferase involved in cell wall biosynthesis